MSKAFNLSRDMINSLYRHNSDGLGCMMKGDAQPAKCLPKTAKAAWTFYMKHIHGRSGVLHARMRTDGDCTIDRVHPYEVIPGKLWMVHNGILSSYRSRDHESDTQKYINKVLRPIIESSPRVWKNEAFLDLVSDDIGHSNRFVLVDNKGAIRFVNRQTGYELGGDWYANSYSFDAAQFFPEHFKPRQRPNTIPAAQASALAAARGQYSGYKPHAAMQHSMPWGADAKAALVKPMSAAEAMDQELKKLMDSLDAPAAKNAAVTPSQLKAQVWRGPTTSKEGPLADAMFPDNTPLTLEEVLEHIVYNVRERQDIRVSMENLRKYDSQEYHGIIQEARRMIAAKRVLTLAERTAFVDVINDTLRSYSL